MKTCETPSRSWWLNRSSPAAVGVKPGLGWLHPVRALADTTDEVRPSRGWFGWKLSVADLVKPWWSCSIERRSWAANFFLGKKTYWRSAFFIGQRAPFCSWIGSHLWPRRCLSYVPTRMRRPEPWHCWEYMGMCDNVCVCVRAHVKASFWKILFLMLFGCVFDSVLAASVSERKHSWLFVCCQCHAFKLHRKVMKFDFAIIHFRNRTIRNRTIRWLLVCFSRASKTFWAYPSGSFYSEISLPAWVSKTRCLARDLTYFPHVCWHLTSIPFSVRLRLHFEWAIFVHICLLL